MHFWTDENVRTALEHAHTVPKEWYITAQGLDMTTPEQADHIRDLMKSAVDDVTVFFDLADFIQHAPKLHDAVVWPHWNGSRNRNRTGYAAAICEINGLRYVGPDPYARLIANDKSLSKVFLKRAGLESPAPADQARTG